MMTSLKYCFRKFALTALAAAMFVPVAAHAQTQAGYLMTQSEKNAIKETIREFIRENPNFILDVLQDAASQQVEDRAARNNFIENPPKALYDSNLSPFVGPEDAEVVVVEFFDYNCGYCKRMINDLNRLIETYPDVKYVFKEMPIMSDESQIAARYALAADNQGKYLEMHTAMMKHYGNLNEKEILRIASGIGLDIKKLQEDLYETEIGDSLTENMQLAQELGIRGTPFFVINGRVLPGAVGYQRLASEVDKARGASDGAAEGTFGSPN